MEEHIEILSDDTYDTPFQPQPSEPQKFVLFLVGGGGVPGRGPHGPRVQKWGARPAASPPRTPDHIKPSRSVAGSLVHLPPQVQPQHLEGARGLHRTKVAGMRSPRLAL